MSPAAWRRPVFFGLAGLLALLPVAYLAVMVWQELPDWRAGYEAAFQGWTYYAVGWAASAATASYCVGRGQPINRALGIGLMTVPLWQTVWGILDSIVVLLQGGFVFRAFTRHELSRLYSNKLLEDLGYLSAGFLLYASDGFRDVLRQSLRRLARRLVEAGFPMGFLGRARSEGRSLLSGVLLFPVLLVATIAVNLFLSNVDSLNQSDESSIFDNMTVYHALLISLAAGFGEELLYRGVLLVGLAHGLMRIFRADPTAGAGRILVMLSAIVLQALLFGLAHGGYGTWSHVLLPALFGLVAGLIAWAFGMWAAITLHVLVDLVAFGAAASSNVDWLWPVLVYAFLANCALTLAWSALWVVRRVEGRRAPPAA
jgi:membrane protease YdiL (CAAX protease family)